MNNTVVLITSDEIESTQIPTTSTQSLLETPFHQTLLVPMTMITIHTTLSYPLLRRIGGLHTLGRWDVGANVFSFVAAKTGDKLRKWPAIPAFRRTFFNLSYPGPFNNINHSVPYPALNTNAKYAGRTVLPSIVAQWKGQVKTTFCDTGIVTPDGMHPPARY